MPSEHIDGEFLDATRVIAFWLRHFSCLPSSIFSFHKALCFSSCSWSPWNSFFYVHRLKSHSAQAITQGWKKRALGPSPGKALALGWGKNYGEETALLSHPWPCLLPGKNAHTVDMHVWVYIQILSLTILAAMMSVLLMSPALEDCWPRIYLASHFYSLSWKEVKTLMKKKTNEDRHMRVYVHILFEGVLILW